MMRISVYVKEENLKRFKELVDTLDMRDDLHPPIPHRFFTTKFSENRVQCSIPYETYIALKDASEDPN
jgi:hypothetical protein